MASTKIKNSLLSDVLKNDTFKEPETNPNMSAVTVIQPSDVTTDYATKYTNQLQAIMDQIINREDFTYDMNSDPAYQQYAQQYQQAGNLAMQDTIGQAAALTGGYGSSYATTAGSQAYQNYLTQLNNIVPDLRSQALSEYNAEGDELTNAYSLLSDAYNRDYTQYSDDKQYSYSTAMDMLNSGLMPSTEMLDAAGISEADAKTIYNANKKSSSSGSSSRSSSSSSSNSSSSGTTSNSASNAVSAAGAATVAAGLYATYKRTGVQPDLSKYSTAVKNAFNSLKTPTK